MEPLVAAPGMRSAVQPSSILAALVLVSCATTAEVEERTAYQLRPTIEILRERLAGCCHDVNVELEPLMVTVTAEVSGSTSDELDRVCALVAAEAGSIYGDPVLAQVRAPDGRGCIYIVTTGSDPTSRQIVDPRQFPAELCTGDCGETP